MTSDEVRSLSSVLYGNADRLRVAAAIGRMIGKPISVKAVSTGASIDYNRAQEQVAWFRRGGLLVPDHDLDSRRKDHRAVDLSYWEAAARLEAELLEREHL
jgi:predicted metalloendopeptidase